MGRIKRVDEKSIMFSYFNRVLVPNRAIFMVAKESGIKIATAGLTALSIIASTGHLFGLFGTVISIL